MFDRLIIKFGASPYNPRGKYRLYKLLTGRSREIEGLTPRGVRLRFRPDDITCYYHFRDNHELELVELIDALPVGGVFVDVGANVGNYSILGARQVGPGGLVVSFEPVAETYARLTRHIALNGITNVITCNAAVAKSEGITEMVVSENSGLSHIGRVEQAATEWAQRVATECLDNYLPPLIGARQIDLLKIDVEGAELGVLRGAEGLLRAGRIRRIHIEIATAHLARFGTNREELWQFLESRGYKPRFRRQDVVIYDEIFDLIQRA